MLVPPNSDYLNKDRKLTIINYFKNYYGINVRKAIKIAEELGLNFNSLFNNLQEYKKDQINQKLAIIRKEKPGIEQDLKLYIIHNIKTKINQQTRNGIRLNKNLPIRGQRTRSNARTVKRMKQITI